MVVVHPPQQHSGVAELKFGGAVPVDGGRGREALDVEGVSEPSDAVENDVALGDAEGKDDERMMATHQQHPQQKSRSDAELFADMFLGKDFNGANGPPSAGLPTFGGDLWGSDDLFDMIHKDVAIDGSSDVLSYAGDDSMVPSIPNADGQPARAALKRSLSTGPTLTALNAKRPRIDMSDLQAQQPNGGQVDLGSLDQFDVQSVADILLAPQRQQQQGALGSASGLGSSSGVSFSQPPAANGVSLVTNAPVVSSVGLRATSPSQQVPAQRVPSQPATLPGQRPGVVPPINALGLPVPPTAAPIAATPKVQTRAKAQKPARRESASRAPRAPPVVKREEPSPPKGKKTTTAAPPPPVRVAHIPMPVHSALIQQQQAKRRAASVGAQRKPTAAEMAAMRAGAADDDDTSSDVEPGPGPERTTRLDKQERKKLRNRKASRLCRLKKKLYVQNLESQCDELSDKNSELQDRITRLERQNARLVEELERVRAETRNGDK